MTAVKAGFVRGIAIISSNSCNERSGLLRCEIQFWKWYKAYMLTIALVPEKRTLSALLYCIGKNICSDLLE